MMRLFTSRNCIHRAQPIIFRSSSGAACAPAGCAAPSCPAPQSDRLHSTDIAFKPSESGWGYNRKYVQNFDKIFGGSAAKSTDTAATAPAVENKQTAASTHSKAVMEALSVFASLKGSDRIDFVAQLRKENPQYF